MKEVTTIVTMEVTLVSEMEEEALAETVKNGVGSVAKDVKRALKGVDDVVVTKVQHFIRDKRDKEEAE